jgi:hypothetical protein
MDYKQRLLENICYTELVYERVNKKLQSKFSKIEIQKIIFEMMGQTNQSEFLKKGKNIYITNQNWNIILTVNSFTNRLITVTKLDKLIPFKYNI